jgi:hypothetical protein
MPFRGFSLVPRPSIGAGLPLAVTLHSRQSLLKCLRLRDRTEAGGRATGHGDANDRLETRDRMPVIVRRAASILILALLFIGVRASAIPSPAPQVGFSRDIDLTTGTIVRIRSGEPYYAAVGDELRQHGYPTKPVVNWRTPLHYETVAMLSVRGYGWLLAFLAICATLLAWRVRGWIGLVAVFGAMMPAMLPPGSAVLPEPTAGVLIALSLGLYHQKRWRAAASFGVGAVFVRELSAIYAVSAGIVAIAARRRDESIIWMLGGAGYVLYFALHVRAALAHTLSSDLARGHSYFGWHGYEFVLQTLRFYAWLVPLPPAVAPFVACAAFAGVFARTAPPQLQLALVSYALTFSLVGQPFDWYWGLVTLGIWGYALTYSAEGAKALYASWRTRLVRGGAAR